MQTSRKQQLNSQRVADHEFFQYPYRWVIVSLMGLMQLINGLTQNTTTPIASKLAQVYGISDAYVTAPITVSFLAYSIMNFPANHIIDTRGLRFSFVLGASLYMAGASLYTLVNKGYFFTIFGSILVSLGQPFIINCPAKIATYWFFDKNRPFATAIMTGLMLIGTGTGFVLPTLVVSERSSVSQAKNQVFYLYAGIFLATAIAFVIVFMFMRKQPPTAPSIGAEQQKSDLKQSFKIFKSNKNLWVFFSGYIIIYGTLQAFSSTVNLYMKPYGYTDFQIALFALILLIMGVIGAIIFSLYLKKTTNYRLTIRTITTLTVLVMIAINIVLNIRANMAIVFIFGGIAGFSVTPIVPISYDLGCQLSFPIGQAQVTGFLNGGAMILAFLMILIITSAVKFTTASQSLVVMIIYTIMAFFGTVLYYWVKIDLKRRRAQQEGHTVDIEKAVQQAGQNEGQEQNTTVGQNSQKNQNVIEMIKKDNYAQFNQEQEVYI